eukprot:6195281-Pleurochrysis_carterae.AAC.6
MQERRTLRCLHSHRERCAQILICPLCDTHLNNAQMNLRCACVPVLCRTSARLIKLNATP